DEGDVTFAVDRDDRDGSPVLDDLALVVAPALDGDADQPALVDDFRLVRLHAPTSRAQSTSASVTSTIPPRSATAISSSVVLILAIPLAMFTQASPRSLKTFASAPPPPSVKRGSYPAPPTAATPSRPAAPP